MQKELEMNTSHDHSHEHHHEKVQPLSNEYWRSIDQTEQTPEYLEYLHREFPQGASELSDPVTRRNFMKIMSASVALAGLASCRMPKEKIVPFVKSPENVVPGRPKFYATTMTFSDQSYGLLVESHEGRPTKIEGNELHGSSRGATHPWAIASVLSLYDPDRTKNPTLKGAPATWKEFESAWISLSKKYESSKGTGLAIISQNISSPSEKRIADRFRNQYPNATWVTYEPISQENEVEGLRKATGKASKAFYNLDQANIVVSIDSDFLTTEPHSVRYTKDFSKKRRVEKPGDAMNRLYAIESSPTATGAMADHRFPVASSRIPHFLVSLYIELQKQGLNLSQLPSALSKLNFDAGSEKWVKAIASDLRKNSGRSVLIAGSHQPALVHALVYRINSELGNVGNTVSLYPVGNYSSNTKDLKNLVSEVKMKNVSTLLILGGNPVYNAPSDLNFSGFIQGIEHTIHASDYVDETSALCEWHLPLSHYLESWSDFETTTGETGIVQPLIRPLYDSRSMVEILTLLDGKALRSGYDVVSETWKGQEWKQMLHDGVAKKSAHEKFQSSFASLDGFTVNDVSADQIEVKFVASASVYDGRFANNGWLQELPQPITKVTWDNPALISPALAKQFGLKNGQWIELKNGDRSFQIPVWIVPGQAKNSITLQVGYGRAQGTIAKEKGFNTYTLRTSQNMGVESGFILSVLGKTSKIASTQDHGSMEGRPIIRETTKDEFAHEPEVIKEMVEHPPLNSLWKEHEYTQGYQWGMVIDLTTCTGCNSCVTSCQSENNIPIVGKEQVLNGREMHWIRIDRYFNGNDDEPMIVHQPMACVHCENAPCEQVCPVNATVHDKEGLNTMVYNRCIGTRYCSNNCPYKVRRFNFFNYTKDTPLVSQMVNNPDVTVRFRGVMEKCTYCIQRINQVRHTAKQEERTIRDGEIKTACQQACPADAITFGNVNDPNSKVSKLKKLDQNYAVLEELNIKPRTTFLAKIRNPNPELTGEA